MVTRTDIVEAARGFTGLPYHPQFPSKGLLLAVAERLGLPKDMSALCVKFKSQHAIKAGDVVVLQISATTAAHGIVTEHKGDLYVVRPDQRTGQIVEHILDVRRVLRVFELPEVKE